MSYQRWSADALEAAGRLNLPDDWTEFHAAFPEYSFDAWEVKRRRIHKAAQAEETSADQVLGEPDAAQIDAEQELLRAGEAYERMAMAARTAGLDSMPNLGPKVGIPDVVNFRIGFFDYETTGLKANFGRTLCMSVTDMFGTVTTLRGDDPRYAGRNRRDDSRLIAACRDQLEQYNILCSWNGKRFDLRYMNGRLMLGGERPMRGDLMHIDLLPISRHYLAWHSHRLDAVAKTLRLSIQKTELDFDEIEAARDGEREAMDSIVEHCEHDVLVLRQVFARYQDLLKVVHR